MTALTIDYKPIGNNGTAQLTARLGDALLAVEKVDLLKPKARDAFAAKLCEHHRAIDRTALDGELLRLAGETAAKPTPAPSADLPELESTAILRPELFHTPDVSGVAVPVRSSFGGEARAKWYVYLHWHGSGKRERRELTSVIELPTGARLLIHPVPGEPSPMMTPAWSAAARRAWLDGAAAPDPSDVFRRICERIAYYLDFSQEAASATTAMIALWSMFTYIYPAWSAVPYLSIGGPLASGKSTVFAVLAQLVFRVIQSSNMTAACLFRTLHEHGGTLLLDEAEKLRDGSPEAGELRSILLSGYKAGSPARRLEKIGDGFHQVAFDVFGPKAIASIANPPEALASRCLRIIMFRAAPDSPKPRRRIDADPAAWQAIRDDLHALAVEHGPAWIELARRSEVVPASLAGRDYELWQPLLALASWLDAFGVGGLLQLMQGYAESASTEGREDATPEADETLLRIVAEAVIEGRHGSLRAGDVFQRAIELDAATFSKWTARGVAAALNRYSLRTHKSHGARVYGRVTVDALRRIETAYGVDLSLPAPMYPNVPHVPPDGFIEAETGAGGVHGAHGARCPGGTSGARFDDRDTAEDSNGDGVPEGWTRDGWRARLLQLSASCEGTNPAQAAELRSEAARLDGGA